MFHLFRFIKDKFMEFIDLRCLGIIRMKLLFQPYVFIDSIFPCNVVTSYITTHLLTMTWLTEGKESKYFFYLPEMSVLESLTIPFLIIK